MKVFVGFSMVFPQKDVQKAEATTATPGGAARPGSPRATESQQVQAISRSHGQAIHQGSP